MKKGVYLIVLVFVLLLVITSIKAITIVGPVEEKVTEKFTEDGVTGKAVTGETVTGESVTGESVTGEATSQPTNVSIQIGPINRITIASPQNTTYYFNLSGNYNIDLNVSANFNVSGWWYDLTDLTRNVTLNSSVFFTPNTTISAVNGSNNLTVYANDTGGNITYSNVTFTINFSNYSPVIENLASNIYACEDSALSYYFNATDVNKDILAPRITPRGTFYITPSRSSGEEISTFEIISGTLDKLDAGGIHEGWESYTRTVSVSDKILVDTQQITITIMEINHAPSITNIGVQTVWTQGENSTFYKQAQATDTEDIDHNTGNITFNISFSGTHLFNISSNGLMNFSANLNQTGVYNVTVCGTDRGLLNPHQNLSLCGQDGSNLSSCTNFSLTITAENRPPNITSYYPIDLNLSVSGSDLLYFNISKYDPDGTLPDTYWYINDTLEEYDSGSSYDEMTYRFGCNVSGNFTIKAEILDGLLNDSVEWNLTVKYAECLLPGVGAEGGGVSLPFCKEKWACNDWGICKDVENALKKGILFGDDYRITKDTCLANNWGEEYCGFQTRDCFDFNECNPNQKKLAEMQECYYTEDPNCHDDIKNCHDDECELLVDCGGPCQPCPTCSDKMQNQGENGVDCGGPCPWPCPAKEALPTLARTPLRYVLWLLLLIVLLFVTYKSARVVQIQAKNKKIKLSYVVIILCLFLTLIFFYLYSRMEIGDFVYKKDRKDLIGEVQNKSVILQHLIQWQNGKYSKEFLFNIRKIGNLNEDEISEILQVNNEQELSLYSWTATGEAITREKPVITIEDLRRYAVRIGEEDCRPGFICGAWSDCDVDYNFNSMIGTGITSGKMYRYCKDYAGCMSDFFYSKTCEIKSPVTIQKAISEEKDYIELYDAKNKLVARLTKRIVEGIEKLDIEIVV